MANSSLTSKVAQEMYNVSRPEADSASSQNSQFQKSTKRSLKIYFIGSLVLIVIIVVGLFTTYFRRTSPEPPTDKTVSDINILTTDNWKTVYNNSVSFKIPPYSSCNNESTCGAVFWKSQDFQQNANYRIDILVSESKGQSLKDQFLSIFQDKCSFIISETYFGDVKALQIANDNTQCSSGSGGIAVEVGNKVVIFPNLSIDPTSKKVERWDIRDTIISTLSL